MIDRSTLNYYEGIKLRNFEIPQGNLRGWPSRAEIRCEEERLLVINEIAVALGSS